jgi:pSer/pThr/pTyr-binding forkhead associated (FHA) protein
MKSIALAGLLVTLGVITAHAQDVTRVDDIRTAPGRYLNEVVTVEGYATQYVENPAQTSSFYYLKDDFGGIITVRTTKEAPEVGMRYTVTGPVGVDPRREDPYISEESRTAVDRGQTASSPEAATSQSASNPNGIAGGTDQTLVYVLVAAIGLVFLALVGVLVYVMRSRRQPAAQNAAAPTASQGPISGSSQPQPAGNVQAESPPADNGQVPEPEQIIEDKTIKMHAPPQGTLKILPGRLKVTSGLDDINEIRFYKPKGQVESEITFGRANGKPYQHIQLKPRTVSSKQAKMVYNEEARQYTIINYASPSSNPTRVNGEPLSVNEGKPVSDGDRIAMGEVEFEYASN